MADKTSLNMNKFFGENYSQVNPSMGVNNSLQINPERIIKTVEKILEPAIQQVQEVSQENSNQNNILQKIVSSFDSQFKSINQENEKQNATLKNINSSFDSLIISATRMKNLTDKILKFIDEDLSEREKISKENEKILTKNTQKNKSRRLTAEQLSTERNNFIDASGAAAGMVGLAAAAGSAMGQPPPAQEPGGGNISGSTNQEKAFNYFVSLGASKEHAAGIVGNLMVESYNDIRPNAENEGHYGIAQWDKGDRWPRLVSWAQSKNKDPQKFETQLEYLTIESGYFKNFIRESVKSAENAAVRWEEIFERSKGQNNQERIRYAKSVLEKYGNNNRQQQSRTPGNQSQTSSPKSNTQPQASATGATPSQTTASSISSDSKQQVAMAQPPIQNDGITPMKMPPPMALAPIDTKSPTNQIPLITMNPKGMDNYNSGVTISNDLFSREPIIDPQNYLAFSNRASLGLVYG